MLPESGSVRLILPSGSVGATNGFGGSPNRRPFLHPPLRPVLLIALIREHRRGEVLLHPQLRVQQPLRAGASDRSGRQLTLALHLAARLTEPSLPAVLPSHDRDRVKLDLQIGRARI
jgi:hypothetical protein